MAGGRRPGKIRTAPEWVPNPPDTPGATPPELPDIGRY